MEFLSKLPYSQKETHKKFVKIEFSQDKAKHKKAFVTKSPTWVKC